MSEIDPTDHALATIASILENPSPAPGVHDADAADEESTDHPVVEEQPLAPEPGSANGYTRVGPGPMVAIRLKWTVHHADDGQFYVHETIGEQSVPVISGPMTGEAAVQFVDEREEEARRRFDELRSEIAGRSSREPREHQGEA